MKRYRRLFATVVAAFASLALLASAAQAATPAPPYEDFAGCPSKAEDTSVASCFKYVFNGGHLQLGKKNIPVTNPIVLRGGYKKNTGVFAGNSEAGIVPVRQTVAGGLIGLTGLTWLDDVLSTKEQLKVYATVESAGQPGTLLGLPLTVPVKVHLENPLLGGSCYVGSNESPIVLNLTTGTTSPPAPNVPISGQLAGEFEPETGRPKVQLAQGGVFVDNSFAVPGAGGCQLNLGALHIPINGLVNAASGLPAAAGTNEAVLNFDLATVAPKVVYP